MHLVSYEKTTFLVQLIQIIDQNCALTILLQKKEFGEDGIVWTTLDSDSVTLEMDLADLQEDAENIITYRYVAFDPNYKDYPPLLLDEAGGEIGGRIAVQEVEVQLVDGTFKDVKIECHSETCQQRDLIIVYQG